jgi:hypothetical protein
MSFPTKKFDFELPTNGGITIAMVGASRSGKTTVMKHIINKYFKKYISTFFTQNPHAPIYKDLDEKILVSDTYYPELINEAHEINKATENEFQFLFVTDDYVDNKIRTDSTITKCWTIMRNAGISMIQSMQDPVFLSPSGRSNANIITLHRQNSPRKVEAVVKEFLISYLPRDFSIPEACRFYEEATKDYQFFVINNLTGECFLTKLTASQIKE